MYGSARNTLLSPPFTKMSVSSLLLPLAKESLKLNAIRVQFVATANLLRVRVSPVNAVDERYS